MKTIALFPGQGSQQIGMGLGFFKSNLLAQKLFDQADQILNFKLSKLCFEGPLEQLTLTENAQPAILVASYVAFRLAQEKGFQPIAAAGHSLGEYTALVAAEALEFTDAVKLVHLRGQYMQQAVQPGTGKMVAVIGSSENEIAEVISSIREGVKEIANLNAPGQTVVAGDTKGIDAFSAEMTQRRVKIIPLNVSAPFHCSLMQPAAEKLAVDLNKIQVKDPLFPVYSNVTANLIPSGNAAKQLLLEQVCSSVRWTELIGNLVDQKQPSHSVEFGSGAVLTKLMKRIRPEIERVEISEPIHLELLK